MEGFGDIVFSLNKGVDEPAYFVRPRQAGILSAGSDPVSSLAGSGTSSGDGGAFCIERTEYDPAVFEILIEFASLQECESSLEEDAGWCCDINVARQYIPEEDGGVLSQFGIEESMVWPYRPEQSCLNGAPCQLYVACVCERLTQGQCEARRIVGNYPRAFTQDQLDGCHPLADVEFFSLGKMRDLWLDTSPSSDYCPLNYVVHDPGGCSSSSSISCGAVECGCDPSLGPCFFLDCGLNPNGEFVVDCGLCKCVEVVALPSSSSSSSSVSAVVSSSSSVSAVVPSSSVSSVEGGGPVFVATHLCVKDRPGAVGVLTGTVELKDLVPTYSQSNVYFVSRAANSGEMTNGATYDSSYPIYETMAYPDSEGLIWVMADYGEVGYFRTVRVGPPPCYVREGGLSTAGAVNGPLLGSGDGCDGSYYYSASVEYSVDGENWFVLGSTTYAPFFDDEKTSVGTELVGDETLKEARYLRVVGNGPYLGLSELHAADDTVSSLYCVEIDEYDQSSQEIVAGPYGSLVSCSVNCPPPPLSFVCVRERAPSLIGRLDLVELGNLVANYSQSNVLSGMDPASSGEMTNGTVYDSSFAIYQTMVGKVRGEAWILADYGEVGFFRKVRVGPPPCRFFDGFLRGARNGELSGDSAGGCTGAYYIGAVVQYSVDGENWLDLGPTTEAPFLNEARTLVGTELVGDDEVKEARYIRLIASGSNVLAASELTAVRLDVNSVGSSASSFYSGEFSCISLQEYDPAVHDLFSGPHSAFDICVAECNPLV